MPSPTSPTAPPPDSPVVSIDLADQLTEEELASFQARATEAGRTLTDHFLAITIGPKPDDRE